MNIFVETFERENNTTIYQGSNENAEVLFVNTFQNEHRGIVEFIGCVHALMYMKKNNLYGDIFIDNEYIKKCVEQKKYKHHAKSEKGNEKSRQCQRWLLDQRKTIIINIKSK